MMKTFISSITTICDGVFFEKLSFTFVVGFTSYLTHEVVIVDASTRVESNTNTKGNTYVNNESPNTLLLLLSFRKP